MGAAIGASASLGGCKRRKPPAMKRVWLGPSHACAMQKSGELECWGANAAGQLGDGTTTARALPGPVARSAPYDELALGARHTCGLLGGSVWCWGDGARGQLGPGPAASRATPPDAVGARDAVATDVKAISAGGDRTCVIASGALRCWGEGRFEPHTPAGLASGVTALAVGPGYVCAAQTEPKSVRCSGIDDRGQAAGGKDVLAGASIAMLTAGGKHTCALLDDGSASCWGGNESGQLGDGTTVDTREPTLVHGLPPAAEIRAGASHTCARLRNNTIACWGGNDVHQLATGTALPSSKPVPLRGLVGVMELALAGNSACARLGDGSVRCWGANSSGQLGDGTTLDHNVPMPLRSSVAAGR